MKRETLLENLFNDTQSLQRIWKQYFYKVLGDEALSPVQMGVMIYLKEHQPVTGKKMAGVMQISASAVTQVIDSLDQMGFIDRQPDEHDRRIIHISLSTLGNDKVVHLEAKRKQFFFEITKSLSNQEVDAMTTIQQKMIQQIDRKLGDINEII